MDNVTTTIVPLPRNAILSALAPQSDSDLRGWQRLVEDFLIKRSTLMRTAHLSAYYEHNSAREHDQPWESYTAPNLFASTVIGNKATGILLESAPTGPAQAMNMLLPAARGSKVPSIPLVVGRS